MMNMAQSKTIKNKKNDVNTPKKKENLDESYNKYIKEDKIKFFNGMTTKEVFELSCRV